MSENTQTSKQSYENPVHVGVAMIPVGSTLRSEVNWLTISRADGKNRIALPSGYQDKMETVVQTVIRELEEELGPNVFHLLKFSGMDQEENWQFVGSKMTPYNVCLDFFQSNVVLTPEQFALLQHVFEPTEEVAAILLSSRDTTGRSPLAFPLHQEMLHARSQAWAVECFAKKA